MLSRILPSILLVSAVSAADICAYTTRSCGGSDWACCRGIPANTCCTWPAAYGWGVGFTSMPSSSWMGYMYGASCGVQTGGTGGTGGSSCITVWNEPSYLAAKSGKWVLTSAKGVVARDETEGCRTANVIGFTAEDGVAHEITVPEGRADEIAELVQAGEYEALLQLN